MSFEAYKAAGGLLSEDVFNVNVKSAEAVLRELTAFAPIPWTDEQRSAYDECLAALTERITDGSAAVLSEHVGNTSVTYAAGSGGRGMSDADFARKYLSGTGLLYRGL